MARLLRRNAWTLGTYALFVAVMIFTISIHPDYGPYEVRSLVVGAMPLAFAAVAQTCVVLGGGIDLSIGAMMAVANVVAARYMQNHDFTTAILLSVAVLAGGTLAGALNGVIAVRTKVPDIVVTLAMSFVWGGVALLILAKPGGGAPDAFLALAGGNLFTPWVPNGILLLIAVVAVVWVPIRLGRLGLALYAVGSDRTAAFRRGVKVGPTRVFAYAVGGFFAACGGLALLMSTGIGSPLAGTIYTLSGISAIVLGGVSLAGGRGGVMGPIIAAFVLTMVPADLILTGTDPNLGQVIQGTLIVLVVMAGGLAPLLRSRRRAIVRGASSG
ncbi:MAG: ABC transporter permease [Chloroflexi bacterium]|nr:MAG: ABC transporter permease [Chloroflexota bacterium]TME52712.1 MAG: ABC transporter permease [Chloroflexota bacterium]